MNKIILKTALKTLACVIAAILLAFTVASLGFPAQMADMCERSGNYSFATGYASLKYSYTKDVKDLARCVQDSILAENDLNTVKFGEKLLDSEDFRYLVENGDVDKQYFCGAISTAQYRIGKKQEAYNTAREAMLGVAGFPKNNAYALLSITVCTSGDSAFAATLLESLSVYTPDEEEADYYNAISNILNDTVSGRLTNE